MIPKGGEGRHLRKSPQWKEANHMNKSIKEAAQKSRKIGCPPSSFAQPHFPHGWVFSVFFSTFLEAYQVVECLACALEDRQPMKGIA